MTERRIPPPIPIDWAMRTPETARIAVHELADGRLRQTIEHAPLPGVTADMVLWYLERVDQDMIWRGRRALAYRFWHPVDHISFERLGEFGVGDRWHITEAFGGDPRFWMEAVFDVTKLDESGFRMEIRRLRRPVVVMDERWEHTADGLRWTVHQTVGTVGPVLGAVSGVLRRRHAAMLNAWQAHNVQEVGNLPHFLPELHAEHSGQ